MVVAHGEPVLGRQVDVKAREDLFVPCILRKRVESPGVVAVLVTGDVDDTLQVRRAGSEAVGRTGIRRSSARRARPPSQFSVNEEECPVGDHRAAETETKLVVGEVSEFVAVQVAHQGFVPAEPVKRSAEPVRSAARYRVDESARESARTDVKGRCLDLELLDGVETARLGVHLPGGQPLVRQSEGIVQHGAVHLEVVHAVVLARDTLPAGFRRRFGRQPGIVLYAPGNGWQPGDLDRRYVGLDSGVRCVEHLVPVGRDDDCLGLDGVLSQPEVHAEVLPHRQGFIPADSGLISDITDPYFVRTAGSESRNVVPPVGTGKHA